MPSKELDTIWKADPHTIAKIAILKAYLKAWFPILGVSKRRQAVLYIDGFAGPGQYTNHPEGSPLAALAVARETITALGPKWIAGHVHCVFIEHDADRCANLKSRLTALPQYPLVHASVINDTFVNGMAQTREAMPESFRRDSPLFVFIDPFGATGVPFGVVAEVLKSPCSEVLINLDADGIARILLAEGQANSQQLLTDLFGDTSWQAALASRCDFPRLCREVLDLYKSKLRSIPNVRYVFPFDMRDRNDALSYYLVFASQNPLGLEKMKEAMRSIDRSGRYCFSDGGVGQDSLFRFDSPEDFAALMHTRFLGRQVLAADLRDFALNETPFTNAKAMLRVLEERELLVVESSKPGRKRSDFAEDHLVSVRFLPEKQPAEVQKGLFDG